MGTLFSIFFTGEPVRNFDDPRRAAGSGVYASFFQAMLEHRGRVRAPSPYEVAFTSLAHSEADIELTIRLAGEVAAELAAQC